MPRTDDAKANDKALSRHGVGFEPLVMRKPITVWERYYKGKNGGPGHYEHNHIEDGHSDKECPNPMCNEQMNAWRGADGWRRTHAYLDEDNIVVGD